MTRVNHACLFTFVAACTQADRSEFNSHVTELIMSEYGSLHGRSVPEGRITDHKKERIEWKFDQMDTNRYSRDLNSKHLNNELI